AIWNTVNSGATNWYSDAAGTTNTGFPGSGTNVTFSTTNVNTSNLSTILGQDFTINSLTFLSGSTPVTIGGLNTLTLLASGGTGITLNSGAAAVTLSTNVSLGASQTWTNNSTNALTVSGLVCETGGRDTMTKE